MNFSAYWRVGRFDKPIGTWLLLWPTVTALLMAQQGHPQWHLLAIFIAGTVCMRTAGCIANDCFDKDIDQHVERTKGRPLATKELRVKQVIPLLLALIVLAASLVMMTNRLTVQLSLCALLLAALYPLGKRFIAFPQMILGIAFAWAVPMAWAAAQNTVPTEAWVFFIGTAAWVFGYDTLYGIVDQKDDEKIGVLSSARTLGKYVHLGIGLAYAIAIAAWGVAGYLLDLSLLFYIGLGLACAHMVWQIMFTMHKQPQRCFTAFKANHWLGLLLAISTLAGFWFG